MNLFEMYANHTPISYPGGKKSIRRLVTEIAMDFNATQKGLVSPFCGGASVEIFAASVGINVHASDGFEPLVEFWQVLCEDAKVLADRVYAILDDTDYDFEKCATQSDRTVSMMRNAAEKVLTSECRLERAAWFFLRNKTAWGAMMFKNNKGFDRSLSMNGNGGKGPFTKNMIDDLSAFRTSIVFKCMDYRDALKAHPTRVAFCDPPYVDVEGRLYGIAGSMQEGFSHQEFYETITSRGTDFIICYDRHPLILDLYKDCYFIMPRFSYGMRLSRDSEDTELLICSREPSKHIVAGL